MDDDQPIGQWQPRTIWPGQLVGSRVACERYGIDRSTLTRRIKSGDIVPLARLDGAAYVFDLSDLPAERP
ncbi:hypothetical protein [Herbiconiux flava]|uniref:DNA-binding protein n=1 Tax=Herbiconiux flava TaxID=881268 RepID=A0A852STW8_9MICO|nr:hypothetical protein [Herbiconiux flava]NYD72307.1 hypothetical protein [Herbiconiux flava]GLK17730.1 hypothetical protein GCM10017602_22120 [Herbiconiux flava]